MYLSRVEIDVFNRSKMRELNHLGAYHNWVENSFPIEKQQQIRTRKLWRIDELSNKKYLLVLSEDKPDLSLLESYGVQGSAKTKNYNIFLNSLKNGERYKFKLTANPTICKAKEGDCRGEVVACFSQQDQIDYLIKKSIKNGFKLDENDFYISEKTTEILKKKESKPLRFPKVVYEGVLTIEDLEIFKKALISGIGRKKAFGFGLLTIIPIK